HNKKQLTNDVEPFNRILMEKGYHKGEVGHIRKDGTTFPTQMTSTILRNENGNPIAMTGILRDITDQKKSEDKLKAYNQQLLASEQQLKATNQQLEATNQQLRASEQHLKATNQQLEATNQQLRASEETIHESENNLRALFNAMTDIVFEMDYDGRYISIAPTSPELMFKPPEVIVGKTLHDIFPKPEADKFLEFIRNCLNDNKITTIEYPLTLNDKTIWFEGRATPKTKNSILYIAHDINERKQTEEKLEYSNSLIQQERNMFMAGPVVVFKWRNTEGWPVEYVSPNVKEVFGFSVKELISGEIFYAELIRSEDTERVATEVAFYSKNGVESFTHQPYRIVRKDGQIIWVDDFTSILRNENGDITHYLGYIVDITEHKQVEKELIKAKERAEESDRLKTAFLHNISHEIRSPMNSILGFTNLLSEPGLSGEEQHEYINVIKKSGHLMLNTINDLMDISLIESGQVKVVVSEVNVNEQIEYLYTFFKPDAEKKGIHLSFINRLHNHEANIKTDHEKVYAILINLIKNAIKFTNEGSIEFGYNKKADSKPTELEFFVKDTGIGIPKNWQQAIFDRFVQAELSPSKKYEGSGLGLSISKAYIEMLGGKIWVESIEGEGSVFYFTIPYSTGKSETTTNNEAESASKSEHEVKKLKILIAEDEEYADLYLTKLLKDYYRKVLHAKTGIEAVDICRNNPDIDLILMDIKMPEMSGYEATRKIREFNKDVVIIAQTAYALTGDRDKAINSGCDDYISKPIEKDELKEIIERYLYSYR
ncbi:MAG: PAS domain S-box protein, partial [Bacteroidales bacterium]|nr:PAS domain S-box protein [Bacteroidales bacterium]